MLKKRDWVSKLLNLGWVKKPKKEGGLSDFVEIAGGG